MAFKFGGGGGMPLGGKEPNKKDVKGKKDTAEFSADKKDPFKSGGFKTKGNRNPFAKRSM